MPFNSLFNAGGDVYISPSWYSNKHTICKEVTCADGLWTITSILSPSILAKSSLVLRAGNVFLALIIEETNTIAKTSVITKMVTVDLFFIGLKLFMMVIKFLT